MQYATTVDQVVTNTLDHVNRYHPRSYTMADLTKPHDHDLNHDAYSACDSNGNFVGYCYGTHVAEAAQYALDNAIPVHHFEWLYPQDTRD